MTKGSGQVSTGAPDFPGSGSRHTDLLIGGGDVAGFRRTAETSLSPDSLEPACPPLPVT